MPKNKIICGLSWISQNNQTSIHAKNKQDLSTSLTKLKSLLHLDNLNFIDLNYVDTTDERIKFYNDFGVKIKKFKQIDSLNKLDELASLINICDLIISVSNTTAHLSAALGKKTFLLLPEKNKKFGIGILIFKSHWYNSNADL